MGIIATLLPDPACLARVVQAARGRHEVLPCESWRDVIAACESEAVHLAVVDLFADGRANFDQVRSLKGRFARVTLVAYVVPSAGNSRDLFDAGRAGLDGLMLAGQDDSPAELRAVMEQAQARGVAGAVRQQLVGLSPLVRDAVMVSITRAHHRLTAHRLAEILSTTRRALLAALGAAGFPPPQKLVTWGRLIVAAQMLEERHRSADSVARILDFPSGSAFRNTCQRYLGAAPQEIRNAGGSSFVVTAFLKTVQRTGKN